MPNECLRAEVERLKRVNDEYGVEEVGKLVDRVQELEKALRWIADYTQDTDIGLAFDDIQAGAKRALDGGSK